MLKNYFEWFSGKNLTYIYKAKNIGVIFFFHFSLFQVLIMDLWSPA